ncbi:DUF3397 domain-containing protein [Neobacillus sp. D3-1R]|uniref:DUF3397 domain-containing protein n=1 Tax=Neobacillus sp. D3-1R TaxID=3445778 RepID=UPI003FA1098B
MTNIISSILAVFITIPILAYFVIFILSKQFTKNHRKSVHFASDGSTIFFILSVHFLILSIWEKSFLWVIFIFLMSCAMIFVIMNWKIKGEIVFRRIFKGFWRFSFLIFLFAYFGLMIYGVIQKVNSYL